MRRMRLLCLLCSIFLICTPCTVANAATVNQENEEDMRISKEEINADVVVVRKNDGTNIRVNVSEQAKGEVTYAELYAVTSEIDENCEITIQEMVVIPNAISNEIKEYKATSVQESRNPMMRAWYDPYYEITTWYYPGEEILYKDAFIISVSKGQTVTLTKKYSYTLKTEISCETEIPNEGKIKSGLAGSISHEITKEERFSGPSEDSKYNCREFRCKYFMTEGYFMSSWVGSISGDMEVYCGDYLEPSRYLMYSIDKKIK